MKVRKKQLMMKNNGFVQTTRSVTAMLLCAIFWFVAWSPASADSVKPVKVFILSGQSNMVGAGKVDGGSSRWGTQFLDPVVSVYKGDYEPGTMSNFGYAGRLTETILIGNLALRAGEGTRIEWDAEKLKSPNVSEVNQFVSRAYRKGWELP
mgnify:CR=1 FL=1